MLRTIKVYGKLRQILGQSTFEADLNNVGQAFSFLYNNFPELEGHLLNNNYRVWTGDKLITEEKLSMSGESEIRIIPIATGSGFLAPFVAPLLSGGISSVISGVVGTGIIGSIVTADGKIIEVIIENVGSNYTSTPNLEIISTTGIGCVLTPIFSNGRLSEVKVIEPGSGYVSGDVSIEITPSEADFSFIPQVQRWRVNLFEKLYNNNG